MPRIGASARLGFRREIAYSVIGAASLLIGLALYVYFEFGAVDAAIQYVDGRRFLVSPAEVDLGNLRPGDSRTLTFTLTNVEGDEIRILGSQADCSCIEILETPDVVATSESRQFRVAIRATEQTMPASTRVVTAVSLFSDSRSTPRLQVSLEWQVSAARRSSE